MLIPLGTDAPVYHFPWVTIGLIGVNTAAFFATGMGDAAGVEPWSLAYGNGLHPVQWLTSNFMHAGFLHLIGNMIFLWTFGLVVEGKIGWWRFLAIYLGLGIIQCSLEQSLLLWASSGHSLGASAVIYGLMAIALIWAPENEIECLWFFNYYSTLGRSGTVELSILSLAGWYIGTDLFVAWLIGFRLSTPVLHLTGALLGLAVGVLMVKKHWVDCENWDLFAVMAGRGGRSIRDKTVPAAVNLMSDKYDVDALPAVEQLPKVLSRDQALIEIRRHLLHKRGMSALNVYSKSQHFRARWELPEPELRQMIDLLTAEKQWTESISLLEEFVRRFPAQSTAARLKLAPIVLREQKRPRYALCLLDGISECVLPAKFARLRDSLRQEAQALLDEGVLEPQTQFG
ncbi:MAG: rhomboid family intramembrane serine protease [Planctomycetia bacterium]|nr:rhomboid family intramembrane serine protease [Planctomycetia bacterium]